MVRELMLFACLLIYYTVNFRYINSWLFFYFLFFQLYFKSNDVYNEQWRNAWIIPAFWQVLSYSLLCIICILWAPSQSATR